MAAEVVVIQDEKVMVAAYSAEVEMEVACEAEVVHKTSDHDVAAMNSLVFEQVESRKQVKKVVPHHYYDESFHLHPMKYLEDNT